MKAFWSALVVLPLVCQSTTAQDTGWAYYGGDAGGARYSSLTQINKENVSRLKVAWTFHTGDVSDPGGGPRTKFEATPILFNMLATNENITSAVFKFWAPQLKAATGVGAEVQNFTVTLTNASIASLDFRQANIRHPDLVKFAEYEEVALTYQKIEWKWMDGGITAIDDWEAAAS